MFGSLGVSETSKSAISDGKQLFVSNQVFRSLGVSETSKSAILDGKQLFLSNQVFGRSRELKIGYFRWKTAVFIKSGVREVQRPQNRLF